MISFKCLLVESIFFALSQLNIKQVAITNNNFNHIYSTLRLQKNRLNYRSAIALSLAGKQSNLACQIASSLVDRLKRKISPNLVQIQVTPPAWIEFRLTEYAIQQWLEDGFQEISTNFYRGILDSASGPETMQSLPQYVRDRCWQLLQLGLKDNLISLRDPTQTWKIVSLSHQNLLLGDDWQLLYHLIATRDGLEQLSSSQQKEKLAHYLSRAFLEFHCHCQLFNRQQPNFHQIAVIRFSAIAITERLLFQLGY